MVTAEILLVMRSGNVCLQVEKLINSLEHRITAVCHSAGNAIRTAGIKKFDIILCSNNLPDMTGLDMAVDISNKTDASILLITSSEEKIYVEIV